MSTIRILLADDHAIVREGLRLLLNGQSDMQVVGEASNGREAMQLAARLRPDVVVMDMAMPELDGVEATRALKGDLPLVKVIVLTMHQDEGLMQQLFKAGASGFVLKRSAAQELARAIRAALAGEIYLDPLMAEAARETLPAPASEAGAAAADLLSEREGEVLRLIAVGHTNKEIAAKLGLSVKTVETYKTRLTTKLGLHSRAEIVRYALHRGLLPED